jgi:hypothetical protein
MTHAPLDLYAIEAVAYALQDLAALASMIEIAAENVDQMDTRIARGA